MGRACDNTSHAQSFFNGESLDCVMYSVSLPQYHIPTSVHRAKLMFILSSCHFLVVFRASGSLSN